MSSSAFLGYLLGIALFGPNVASSGISSQIDLDDDPTTPPATLTTSVLKAFLDLSAGEQDTGPSSESPNQSQPASPNASEDPEDDEYINIRDLFKNRQQPIPQHPPEDYREEPQTGPTIVNNIHITITNNRSDPEVRGCPNGICNVSVSSRPDDDGNVVTSIQLSIVTKLKDLPPVKDIPVITGTTNSRRPDYDQLPPFHFYDPDNGYNRPAFDNNIPPLPIHRQDVDTWYRRESNFHHRPRNGWQHRGKSSDPIGPNRRGGQGPGWEETRSRGIINDKIEPPFSETPSANSE